MVTEKVLRLVFGVATSPPEDEAAAAFAQLAAWMRSNESLELERKPCASYRALAASVREGESDLAWLPPVVYAWLAEAVTPLGCVARGGQTSYSAAIVTRAGSPRKVLADLAGARAGWVDPWSAAGYVIPRMELVRAGIEPSTTFASETFYGSHRDVLRALARGDCDVAGTYARSGSATDAAVGAWSALEGLEVRVIATFGSIPPDVLAVRRNLHPAQYDRALSALRNACADASARPLVRAVFGGDELREGIEAGHDTLRRSFERAVANGLFD